MMGTTECCTLEPRTINYKTEMNHNSFPRRQNTMTKEINNGTDIQPSDNVRVDEQKLRLDSADLGASKPVPVAKPEPKRTLEHAVVKACGHSIDLRHPPTQANCEDCWTAFFTLAVDTPSLHKILVAQGRVGLVAIVGKKFVKSFG